MMNRNQTSSVFDNRGIDINRTGASGPLVLFTDLENVIDRIHGNQDRLVIHFSEQVAEGLDAA